MKNLVVSLLFIATLLVGCDKVPTRIPPVKPECMLDSAELFVNTNADVAKTRKVLLEDYTGHMCGNCPPAVAKVEELIEKNPRLIALANHVTATYAAPQTTKYKPDFRDPASTEWDLAIDKGGFGMSGSGLPGGSVNRRMINNAYRLDFSTWEQHIKTELAKPQSVKLDVTTYYDPSQKLLNVRVFSTFKQAIPSNVNLSLVLSLDSVVSDQKDYTPPAGAIVDAVDKDRRPDFRFNHIMFKSLNGSWGQLLKAGPIAQGDTATVYKECNSVTKCFGKNGMCADDKHTYLVVFVFNADTKEVLQVEKVKLIPDEE